MERKAPTLFGYGKTTKAIAKAFGPCIFYDDNIHKPFTDEEGNRLKPSSEFNPKYSTLEIPSPGIPPEHLLIKRANNLMSEYDFFADVMPYSIWLSGTNGKTTTTQMMEHLLRDKGAVAGGNIGTPLAELNTDDPIWILETSSFTLHYTNKARPNIYVLLPISPDHLSWHGSYEAYVKDKLKPLAWMQEGEAVILPREFADKDTNGFVIPYDSTKDLADYFGFDLTRIKFEGAFLMDAVIAMGIDKILYDRTDYERINTFMLDPHRQEELYDTQKRLWVNDTKATNIDATVAALQRYKEKPIHLILGGDDKGVELTPLFEVLKTLNVTLYTIGSNEARLNQLAEAYKIPFHPSSTLDKAIKIINLNHDVNSVALLSPAAASLDQFSSYAERGNQFKKTVSNLS